MLRRLLRHLNLRPNQNPHPHLLRSRLRQSASFRHPEVQALVAKRRLRPLLHQLHQPLQHQHQHPLPLPKRRKRRLLRLLRPKHLQRAHRCRSVLRPRRRASRFRLRPARVLRFLPRVSPSHRPPACVAKRLLPARVLVVVPVVLVLAVAQVVPVAAVALVVRVPVAAVASTAHVPAVVLVAAVPVAALVVPVVDPVVVLVVVLVAAVVLVVAPVVVPVVRVRSVRGVVVVTATNFSRSMHRATRLAKHPSRLAKLS